VISSISPREQGHDVRAFHLRVVARVFAGSSPSSQADVRNLGFGSDGAATSGQDRSLFSCAASSDGSRFEEGVVYSCDRRAEGGRKLVRDVVRDWPGLSSIPTLLLTSRSKLQRACDEGAA